MSRPRVPIVVLLALAFHFSSPAGGLKAGEPFFYYPAYGAHRGKIVYRDGLLVDRQKIRWGGGITANGAAVFHDLFAAAVPIAQSFAGGKEAEDRGLSDEEFSRQRGIQEDKQAAAETLLAQTIELRRAFGVPDPTPVNAPANPNVNPGASATNDTFSDWDSGTSNVATPGAAAPSNPALPVPPAIKLDDFKDWENNE